MRSPLRPSVSVIDGGCTNEKWKALPLACLLFLAVVVVECGETNSDVQLAFTLTPRDSNASVTSFNKNACAMSYILEIFHEGLATLGLLERDRIK